MTYGAADGCRDMTGQIDLDDRAALDGMTKVAVASFNHGPNPMANEREDGGRKNVLRG